MKLTKEQIAKLDHELRLGGLERKEEMEVDQQVKRKSSVRWSDGWSGLRKSRYPWRIGICCLVVTRSFPRKL